MRIAALMVLAAAALWASPQPTVPQDATDLAFARILTDYRAAKARSDVGTLVLLDQELRTRLPWRSVRPRQAVASSGFKKEYAEVGIAPLMFDASFLGYSGKLLREAHAINPRSPLRGYTAYSTIFDADGETGNGIPIPSAGNQYLAEFPDGPFVLEAHWVMAGFYDDLFKVIRDEESGKRVSYKYDCFKAHLTARPLREQRQAAQSAGIRLYTRLVELMPAAEPFTRGLKELTDGTTNSWKSGCAD
jgi:hypothetical protein